VGKQKKEFVSTDLYKVEAVLAEEEEEEEQKRKRRGRRKKTVSYADSVK
jgi:hypothetical protein